MVKISFNDKCLESRWGRREEKNNVVLADNPYADANADSYDYDGGVNGAGDKKIEATDLFEYELPQHRFTVEYFKILHHDVYESEKRHLPNVILTFTSKNEIYLWQENLMSVRALFADNHL